MNVLAADFIFYYFLYIFWLCFVVLLLYNIVSFLIVRANKPMQYLRQNIMILSAGTFVLYARLFYIIMVNIRSWKVE